MSKASTEAPEASLIGPVHETGSGRIQSPLPTDSPYAQPGAAQLGHPRRRRPPPRYPYQYDRYVKQVEKEVEERPRPNYFSAEYHHAGRPDLRKKELGYSSSPSRWESGVSYAENDYVLPTDDEAALRIRVTEVGSKLRRFYQMKEPPPRKKEGGDPPETAGTGSAPGQATTRPAKRAATRPAGTSPNPLGVRKSSDWNEVQRDRLHSRHEKEGGARTATRSETAMGAKLMSVQGTPPPPQPPPPPRSASSATGESEADYTVKTGPRSSGSAADSTPFPRDCCKGVIVTKREATTAGSVRRPGEFSARPGQQQSQSRAKVTWRQHKTDPYGVLRISEPGEPDLTLKIPTGTDLLPVFVKGDRASGVSSSISWLMQRLIILAGLVGLIYLLKRT